MTNVITFKPRTQQIEEAPVAPDSYYLITSLDSAVKIAAYVYKDLEAVEMLLLETGRFYATNTTLDKLPLELRTRCAKYLIRDEQYEEDLSTYIDCLGGLCSV